MSSGLHLVLMTHESVPGQEDSKVGTCMHYITFDIRSERNQSKIQRFTLTNENSHEAACAS